MLALEVVAQLCEHTKEPLNHALERDEFYGMCQLRKTVVNVRDRRGGRRKDGVR